MSGGKSNRVLHHCIASLLLFVILLSNCSGARSPTRMCISNCAQCKRTYGMFFEGQKCAEYCIKYRGMFMPDCNDGSTISSFLNKLE